MPPLSTKTVSVRTAATNKGKPKRTKRTKAPVRRVSYFNTTGAMEMRKMSLGAAYGMVPRIYLCTFFFLLSFFFTADCRVDDACMFGNMKVREN